MKKLLLGYTSICLILFLLLSAKIHSQDVGAKWVVPPVMDISDLEISPREDDSRFVVKKAGKSGVFDKHGNSVLQTEYDNITLMTCGWIRAKKDKSMHLFNAKAVDIGLPYEKFIANNNGTAIVYKDSLCGLIDQKGEELVPVRYEKYSISDGVYVFTKGKDELRYNAPPLFVTMNEKRTSAASKKELLPGLYIVKDNNLNGLVNEKGEIVVPSLYKFGAVHKKGYIVASFDGKTWGVIDTHHKTLYPIKADNIGWWTKSGLLPVRLEKQWGLLRFPSAEIIIPFGEYEKIEVYDAEKEIFMASRDKKNGLIKADKTIILPFEYNFISETSHITTRLNGDGGKDGFWYRPNGFRQEPIYDNVINLSDSLVIVQADSTNALIDAKNGKEVIGFSTFILEKKYDYFVGTKIIKVKENPNNPIRLTCLYDRTGKLVFEPDSVKILVFPDGSYWVHPHYLSASKLCEHRSKDGKLLRTLPSVGVEARDQFWIFNSKNPEGKFQPTSFSYLDPPGKENYYQSVGNLTENLRLVKQGKFFGFTSNEGEVIIKPVFDAAENSKDGYIKVKYQGKWGVLQNPKFDYFEQ